MEFSLINLFAVLLAAWVGGSLVSKLGYPSILGELLAGIIFGPAVLGWLQDEAGLHVLADVGVYLLMLYIGMQVDHRELQRASWPGLMAAIGGFIIPFGAGYAMTVHSGATPTEGLFLGLAMGVTSLVSKSRILAELNLFGTRLASITLAAALISDTAALIIFAAILSFVETGALSPWVIAEVTGKVVLFFAVVTFLGLKVFPVVGARLMKAGFRQRTANFTLLLLVGLVFAAFAELAGLHSILGAFMAGLFVREGVLRKKLSHEISTLVHDLSIGFLAPIFFVTSGFSVSLGVFQTDLGFLLAVMAVATLAKIAGATLFYLPTRRNWREGFVAGLAMNGRGAVEIILAQLGLQLGLISQSTFSVLVFMAFFTTATVPVLLKWGVAWLTRRGELEMEQAGVRRTLIFGAGPIGMAFAKVLAPTDEIVLIDRNREHCLAAEREGLKVVSGDALRYETLEDAGASVARRLIAASSNADINSLVAGHARENFRIPEVYSLIPAVTEEGMHSLLKDQGIIPLTAGNIAIEDWERWMVLGNTENDELQVLENMSAQEAAETWFHGQYRLPLAVISKEGGLDPFRMDRALTPGDRVSFVRYIPTGKAGGEVDKFDELIANAQVLDWNGGATRAELFARLAQEFGARLQLDPLHIKYGLLARESQGGTVLAPGIAVPHVELDEKGRLELIVVRVKEGVQFSADEPAVKAVFAVATSRDERTAYLRVLSAIAQILRSPTFAQRWLELDGAAGIREFLRTAKRLRF